MKELQNVKVAIIMGSQSDFPVMKAACDILDELEVSYHKTVVSAHRTPDRMYQFAKEAEKHEVELVIAGAGGAAHLPGMVAALTYLPVIGVPVKSSSLSGIDSLLSIVQMPRGVPVATVAINNAKNAGLLAAQILGGKYPEIREKIKTFRKNQTEQVLQSANNLK